MLLVPDPEATSHVVAAGPLEARLSEDLHLRIGWGEPDWLGPATLQLPDPSDLLHRSGPRSNLVVEAGWMFGEVAAIEGEPALALTLTASQSRAGIATGDFASPAVAWHFMPSARASGGAPEGLRAFGHQYTEFALPVFSDEMLSRWRLLPFRPAVVMPLGLVAPDSRTLLLAPLDRFHDQVIGVPAGKEQADAGLRVGWHGDIDEVEAGFTTRLAIIAGDGLRDCFARWARLLRRASDIPPPARDADVLGTRLSYWTDNGSAYWYRTEPGLDTASTVVAAVDDLEARGAPIGAVQLDSWWYPHEVLRPFDTDEWVVPPSGMVRWEPRDDVLPDGIPALRERLRGRPLVVHCRHLSSQSDYAADIAMWTDADRAHPRGPELYERLLDQCVGWGVEVFEHDWLIECFLGVRGLRAPGRAAAWQEGIDAALEARDLHAQWCMASPADFAMVSRLRNVTSIRTSGDHGYLVGPEILWAWFLHTNVMARALGLWPYKDVFHSTAASATRDVEALLSAMSAGPVGIGDRIGEADIAVIRRTCRADGVLVRPDVPIAAVDRTAFTAPVWSGEPIVASTHTDHDAGRWGYVLTCNVGSDEPATARVQFTDLGGDRPGTADLAVFDWRTGGVEVLPRDGAFETAPLARADWDYRVLAPVHDNGIAVFGDTALYACAGDSRVAAVTTGSDETVVTLLGAGERVRLRGWSRRPVGVRAWSPGRAADPEVANDPETGAWSADVVIAVGGWTKLYVSPS
jgi:hypothetical protein